MMPLACRLTATLSLLLLLAVVMIQQLAEAWRHLPAFAPSSSAAATTASRRRQQQQHNFSILYGGGFGGGGGSVAGSNSTKNKEKDKKLKPKQQWDRYVGGELKKATKVQVAARVVANNYNEGKSEWLVVGSVKSKDNAYTKIAVVRQRALIAEHARRLYPLKVSAKDALEWGYKEGGDDDEGGNNDWTVVDKSILESDDVPENVEKMIGFEGKPDPNSGFYCVYNEGKLINGGVEVKASLRTASVKTGMTSPGKLRSGDK